MKTYKKREFGKLLSSGKVIFLGSVRSRRRRYDTNEITRISRSSIVNSSKGLEGVFSGNIAKMKLKRYGEEERKVSVGQVIIGGRLISYGKYNKYCESDKMDVVGFILGWQH